MLMSSNRSPAVLFSAENAVSPPLTLRKLYTSCRSWRHMAAQVVMGPAQLRVEVQVGLGAGPFIYYVSIKRWGLRTSGRQSLYSLYHSRQPATEC